MGISLVDLESKVKRHTHLVVAISLHTRSAACNFRKSLRCVILHLVLAVETEPLNPKP